MSAYNSIDEAYANAVQVLTDAANSDGLGIVELEAILSDVDAAYEDTESWFDWGESEAGAFWANLAARSVYWSAFSDDRQARIDAWLAQVPVAVASSAQTVEDQSYYTIAAGTVEASAAVLVPLASRPTNRRDDMKSRRGGRGGGGRWGGCPRICYWKRTRFQASSSGLSLLVAGH